jgi:hypothetical protein
MYNHDLLNKMIDKFGIDKVAEAAEIISFMHDVLYNDALERGNDELTEHNFERDWWQDKFDELKTKVA